MKKFIHILGLVLIIFGSISCVKTETEVSFKDQDKYTIYTFLVAHQDKFSSFLSIVEKGGIGKILSAYNPYADGYTLFLPDNKAVDEFIQASGGRFNSLNDLLNDAEYVSELCKYHVIRKAYISDEFPFGAFSSYTLSWDYLTASFISEADAGYSKINNQARVIEANIQVANGYIHVIGSTLKPVTYTTYDWLEENKGYSIFKDAVDITGLKSTVDINLKDKNVKAEAFTLLVEHDTTFNKRKIKSLQDLQNLISPGNTDYTNPSNPLYNFVAYHLLVGNKFLNNFEALDYASNYNTYSDIPLQIDGTKEFITIHKEREIFDTIVIGTDTTYKDYISVDYDASNILTQSGVIHVIDEVLTQKPPILANQSYRFYEEGLFWKFRQIPATYLIEDSNALNVIKYSGADLFFVTGSTSYTTRGKDYLMIDGNFTISYTIPKIIQGLYDVCLIAETMSSDNAVVQVYVDGKSVGSLIDLTSGGMTWDPFVRQDPKNNTQELPIGQFNFMKYEPHTVVIKSLIPGKFRWEAINFNKPTKN